MREPEVGAAAALDAAYRAKALAELGDADAAAGLASSAWTGPIVGARIAFLVAHPVKGSPGGVASPRVADALGKAAEALGADGNVVVLATRPRSDTAAAERVRRLRIALEAIDAPAIVALDAEAADDLAAAFGVDRLLARGPVRAVGRSLGYAGDFAASLDDAKAKASAWAAMKAIAAHAGIKAKGRPKAPPEKSS